MNKTKKYYIDKNGNMVYYVNKNMLNQGQFTEVSAESIS